MNTILAAAVAAALAAPTAIPVDKKDEGGKKAAPKGNKRGADGKSGDKKDEKGGGRDAGKKIPWV